MFMSTNELKAIKETSKKQKKEEEVQNTPTLKSGREIKSQYLHDTRIWPVNWFQKFYKRGTIFHLCYAFAA